MIISIILYSTLELQQPIIEWTVLVPRMLNFTTNFSVEQVHLHPVACK